MERVLQLEKEFGSYYLSIFSKIEELYSKQKDVHDFSLDNDYISKSIVYRLAVFYSYQNQLKQFLDKRIANPAADFFVETVLFYTKLILEKKASNFHASSERKLDQSRKSLRPDISIWDNENKLVAVIECKTQLGRKRSEWESEFTNREKEFQKINSNVKVFLVVMTNKNWPGFGNNPLVNHKYFTISKYWPRIEKIEEPDLILNHIENLFKQLV